VRGLLFGPRCAFVLAAGPAPRSVAHATQFLERLEGAGADVRGLVLNRMRIWPGDGAAPRDAGDPADDASARASLARALAADGLDEAPAREAAAAALRVARSYASLVRSDEAVTERLRERVRRCGGFVREVPEFRRDVHDLESLSRVADHVFGSGRARAEESSPV
jgi:hypothetical protein